MKRISDPFVTTLKQNRKEVLNSMAITNVTQTNPDEVEVLEANLGCDEIYAQLPDRQGVHISGAFVRNLETGEDKYLIGITPYPHGTEIDHVEAMDSPILVNGKELIVFLAKSSILFKLYSGASTKEIKEANRLDEEAKEKFRKGMA